MSTSVFLLVLNMAIGFALVYFIRKQDIYHTETFKNMTIATVLGGSIAVGITYCMILFLRQFGLYETMGVVNFFVFTGPIEETSKLLGFLVIFRIFKIHFDEPVDAAVYMSCVALGFSLIENFLYALNAPYLLGLRTVTATPMHIIFSTTMALVFVANSSHEQTWKGLLKAVLIASFLHGLYDTFVYLRMGSLFVLYAIVAIAIVWGKKIFGYALLNSPHRKDLLSSLTDTNTSKTKFCANCNDEGPHRVLLFQKSDIDECLKCENIVLPAKKGMEFLNFFLPHHTLLMQRQPLLVSQLATFYVEFHHSRDYSAYAKIKAKQASPLIEDFAEVLRKNFEQGATFSFIFGTRPLISRDNGIINQITNDPSYKNVLKIMGALILTVFGLIFFIMVLLKLLT